MLINFLESNQTECHLLQKTFKTIIFFLVKGILDPVPQWNYLDSWNQAHRDFTRAPHCFKWDIYISWFSTKIEINISEYHPSRGYCRPIPHQEIRNVSFPQFRTFSTLCCIYFCYIFSCFYALFLLVVPLFLWGRFSHFNHLLNLESFLFPFGSTVC